MNDIPAGELRAREDALENAAASLLGHMLFEFSRLDVNLGLCLVWVDGGTRLESLTKSVGDYPFKAKLDELSKHVNARFPQGSESQSAYKSWIRRTHAIRQHRNDLVHGRWGVKVQENCVITVIGLPTSDMQKEIKYSIDELAAINDEIRFLRIELERLRERWRS